MLENCNAGEWFRCCLPLSVKLSIEKLSKWSCDAVCGSFVRVQQCWAWGQPPSNGLKFCSLLLLGWPKHWFRRAPIKDGDYFKLIYRQKGRKQFIISRNKATNRIHFLSPGAKSPSPQPFQLEAAEIALWENSVFWTMSSMAHPSEIEPALQCYCSRAVCRGQQREEGCSATSTSIKDKQAGPPLDPRLSPALRVRWMNRKEKKLRCKKQYPKGSAGNSWSPLFLTFTKSPQLYCTTLL